MLINQYVGTVPSTLQSLYLVTNFQQDIPSWLPTLGPLRSRPSTRTATGGRAAGRCPPGWKAWTRGRWACGAWRYAFRRIIGDVKVRRVGETMGTFSDEGFFKPTLRSYVCGRDMLFFLGGHENLWRL